jgi:hypothetical protein
VGDLAEGDRIGQAERERGRAWSGAPDKSLAFVVHAELQTKNGILNHENLIFDELIADKKYQFLREFNDTRLLIALNLTDQPPGPWFRTRHPWKGSGFHGSRPGWREGNGQHFASR